MYIISGQFVNNLGYLGSFAGVPTRRASRAVVPRPRVLPHPGGATMGARDGPGWRPAHVPAGCQVDGRLRWHVRWWMPR